MTRVDRFVDLQTQRTCFGPDLNRDTVGNVMKAGFRIRREENVYPDIVKTIEAVEDAVPGPLT